MMITHAVDAVKAGDIMHKCRHIDDHTCCRCSKGRRYTSADTLTITHAVDAVKAGDTQVQTQ